MFRLRVQTIGRGTHRESRLGIHFLTVRRVLSRWWMPGRPVGRVRWSVQVLLTGGSQDVTTGKNEDTSLFEAGSAAEVAEALLASGASMICWITSTLVR